MKYTLKEIRDWCEQGHGIHPEVVLDLLDLIEGKDDRNIIRDTEGPQDWIHELGITPCSVCGSFNSEPCGFAGNETCSTPVCELHRHAHPVI